MDREQRVTYTEDGLYEVVNALVDYPEDQRFALVAGIIAQF